MLHSVPHVETLLEALAVAGDLECQSHTAQSASLRLGGAHLPKAALEREVSDELSTFYCIAIETLTCLSYLVKRKEAAVDKREGRGGRRGGKE